VKLLYVSLSCLWIAGEFDDAEQATSNETFEHAWWMG